MKIGIVGAGSIGNSDARLLEGDKVPDFGRRRCGMNTVVDILFITPMSWLLAVPIVLLDRLLAPELPVSPD
ncbi:hypothetical protein ACWPOB_01380 [Rhodococcus sp. 2H158]